MFQATLTMDRDRRLRLCPPTGALQIESSEESDQGKYECVATNSAGTRYSAPANLYVRGKNLATPGSVSLEPSLTCQARCLEETLGQKPEGLCKAFLPASFCSSSRSHHLRSSQGAFYQQPPLLAFFPFRSLGKQTLPPPSHPWEYLYLL